MKAMPAAALHVAPLPKESIARQAVVRWRTMRIKQERRRIGIALGQPNSQTGARIVCIVSTTPELRRIVRKVPAVARAKNRSDDGGRRPRDWTAAAARASPNSPHARA